MIVTGASRGIGRELAIQLASQNAMLSLAARTVNDLEEVAAKCRRFDAQILVVPTDVSEKDQCQALIQQTVEAHNRIDLLINNAGITMWARFDDLKTLTPIQRLMQVNYFGSLYCTYYALPHLKEIQGQIGVISSIAGKTGVPLRSGYAASKHALTGFFETLRIELAEHGISISLIYPDFVSTETRKRAFGPDGNPLGKSPVREDEVMSAEQCAREILKATAQRKRDLIMSPRGKVGQWVKLIAPEIPDRIAMRAIERGR